MQTPLEQEIARRQRARNWAAIVAMGPAYKAAYLIAAGLALVLLVLGFLSMFQGHSGTLLVIGFIIGLVVNGGMTIVANITQAVRSHKQSS